MTCDEFSDQMDVLLNSFNVKAGFGEQDNKYGGAVVLDEYEKSVYLTRAQERLVLSLYNGRNGAGESFESDEETRRHLSPLVSEARLAPMTDSSGTSLGVSGSSKFFTLPDDLWFIVYESVLAGDAKCDALGSLDVYPVTLDDYHRTSRNPFRGANDRRALRLDLADGVVEIVSKKDVSSYFIRYVRKLDPIILRNLPDGLTIGGRSSKTECGLHEGLHQRILELAVAEAFGRKAAGVGNNSDKG